MKPRHAAPLALVITWYLMAPPSMREDSWSCSGVCWPRSLTTFSETGDQNVCEQWAKIADLNAPLSKWHEMGSIDTLGSLRESSEPVRDRTRHSAGEYGAVFCDRQSAPYGTRAADNGSMKAAHAAALAPSAGI
jgi:hypothetical protein